MNRGSAPRSSRAASTAPRPREQAGDEGALWTRPKIEALLRVSETGAFTPQLSEVLEAVAMEACHVTSADAAHIVLAEPGGSLQLAASWGHSRRYVRFLSSLSSDAGWMSRRAVDQLKPMAVDDLVNAPGFTDRAGSARRRMALREGYVAFLSVPLVSGQRASGSLDLYRTQIGPWPVAELELLALFAQHAAIYIDGTQLIDSQQRQVDALERLVGVLRDQTHEHANRLQAVSGLLALDEVREAQQFLAQLMTLHHANYASVVDRVHHPILAALLVAQMSVARQRGVEVILHKGTRITGSPASIGNAEAVTIVAYLMEKAVESVATMPRARRRVVIRMTDSNHRLRILVRNWGSDDPNLATIAAAVARLKGTLDVKVLDAGVRVLVTLPRQ